MKYALLITFSLCLMLALVTPALAQNTGRGSGLIPCGVDANKDGLVDKLEQCTYKDVIKGIQGLVNFLFKLAAPVATVMFAYAGFKLLTANGDTSKLSEAKSLMTSVGIGFIIMLVAWLIVYTITTGLIDPDSGFSNMLKQ
jgi:hypothetical protein